MLLNWSTYNYEEQHSEFKNTIFSIHWPAKSLLISKQLCSQKKKKKSKSSTIFCNLPASSMTILLQVKENAAIVLPALCIIQNILYLIFLARFADQKFWTITKDLANQLQSHFKICCVKALSQQAKKPELIFF